MQNVSYQEEQNQVLEYLLKPFDIEWSKNSEEQHKSLDELFIQRDDVILELYITPECNQACEYCYLNKNKDKIYPKEIRDTATILKNLEIILNFCLERNYTFNRMDLFSGEIWGWPLGNEVFNILLKYIEKGLNIVEILIPSNFSFCVDKRTMKVVSDYILTFAEYGTRLVFSCSMDGPVLDKINRPFIKQNVNIKTEEYYQNIFQFCKTFCFGFHPMIAASQIELQKENYDGWIKLLQEAFEPNKDNLYKEYGRIMQLEVRDDSWTTEKIISYLDWLNYIIDTDLDLFFQNDKKAMADYCLSHGGLKGGVNTYFPYRFMGTGKISTCSIGAMLCIRLGDLSICPCHRTSYEKFLLGKFIVKDNKIIGVEGGNIQLANTIYRTSSVNKPKCDSCLIANSCLRGCYGAQYESSGEILYPVESNCNLQWAKLIFLSEKYRQNGFLKLADKARMDISAYNLLIGKEFRETKEYKEWKPIVQKILCKN